MSVASTAPSSRHVAIDALRGWALVGIAIVNVPWIGYRESLHSMLTNEATRASLPPLDVAAALFVEGLCEGRFYPIFSALFGFGTGVLLDRGLAPYARRIAVLFVFGALHATFGWYGDVLLNYAFAGVVLAMFAKLGARPLFALAAVFFAITQALSLAYDDWFGPLTPERVAEHAAYVESELRAYRDGDFVSISRHRFGEMLSYFASYNTSYRANVLAMATLGLALERWLSRDGSPFERLPALRPRIGRWALGLGAAGIALSALLAVAPSLYIVAGDVLAGGYALGFLWLVLGPRAARWATPLAAVGRTALTCYLVQTLCFTTVFYGYGLALYGALGPAEGLGLAVAVYAGEAFLATLWLRRFEHGPLEWLWRAATYLRAPPFRRR